jgi:hypothetical protein
MERSCRQQCGSLVGVTVLGYEDQLVEVEAVAIRPPDKEPDESARPPDPGLLGL